MTKLSIVLGTLDVGPSRLERLIQSVINQDYANYELIIMDGGSKDGSVDVLKQYEKFIAYWVSEPDNGVCDAVKRGTHIATGDLVGFVGGDDFFASNVFSSIVNAYETRDADVIYGNLWMEKENGEWVLRKSQEVETLDSLYYSSSAFCTAGTFARREKVMAIWDPIDISIANDAYLWGMFRKNGARFVYIDKPTAYFSFGGISTTKQYPVWKDTRKIRLKVIEGDKELENRWIPILNRIYGGLTRGLYSRIYGEDYYIQLIKKELQKQKDYILFGAGKAGRQWASFICEAGGNIDYFIDSDVNLHLLEGYRVYRPEVLNEDDLSKILITSEKYEKEIRQIIEKLKPGRGDRVRSVFDVYYDIYQEMGDNVLDEAYKEGLIN